MNAAVERIQHVARSRDAEHDISRCHDIQLQVLKCFKKILIWWCRLFSWELTIKINNFEITDLHMLIHASVRTQENNFGSKLFSCGVQTSGHRKIIFMGGEFTRTYLYVKPQEKKVPWLFEGVWFFTWLCKKGTNTYVQLHQPKKWLEEAEAQVSKIKSKGLDLFLTEYLRDNLQRLAHRKKIASPGQSSTDRTWWDEFKNFVSTRPNCKTGVFFLKIHLSFCKRGTTTYVQLHQPKKGDLKRPRRRCQK